MKIAEVSQRFGISLDTLRYYERIGLLPPVKRNGSGVREYDEQDLRWIEFIQCMKRAGLSLEVLKEYLQLVQQGDETIPLRKEILQTQRAQLAKHIQELQETLDMLDRKIAGYESRLLMREKQILSEMEKSISS